MQRTDRASPRYELISGALLVTPAPSPRHQRAVVALLRPLDDFATSAGIGVAFVSPSDLELEPGTVAQPDVFVVPAANGRTPDRWSDVRELLLAVEILSSSSAKTDRVTKRLYFARAGVPEYWIVDIDARVIERWRPGYESGERIEGQFSWFPDGGGGAGPLIIDVAELFNEICG